jgi:hypothetical protein
MSISRPRAALASLALFLTLATAAVASPASSRGWVDVDRSDPRVQSWRETRSDVRDARLAARLARVDRRLARIDARLERAADHDVRRPGLALNRSRLEQVRNRIEWRMHRRDDRSGRTRWQDDSRGGNDGGRDI